MKQKLREWLGEPTHKIVRIERRRPLVSMDPQAGSTILIASTAGQNVTVESSPLNRSVRGVLGLSEMVIDGNPTFTVSTMPVAGVKYPEDYKNYKDYYDAYSLVPLVARAVDIKNFYVWQAGYDLEGDEAQIEAASGALASIDADTILRYGSLWAAVFGNFYWHIEKATPLELKPLNPISMGVKKNDAGEITTYVYKPEWNKPKQEYPADEVLHLRFGSKPWDPFGYGTLARVLLTVKAVLYIEKYLPEIARQRGDPWLNFTIKDPVSGEPYTEEEHNRIKKMVLSRKPGENLIHDGSIEVSEIYQAAGVGGRQTLDGILDHYVGNLIGGLGVPEVYLGFGSTTLKGTAEHQEAGFESEVRSIQRALKRFQEQRLWPLLGIGEDVKVMWRPLKPEDKKELSTQLMAEIEHAVVTPDYARQRLGYPELGEGDDEMAGDLLIHGGLVTYGAPMKIEPPETEPEP